MPAVTLTGPSKQHRAESSRRPAAIVAERPSSRDTGCTGTVMVRMDSAFYGAPAVSAGRSAGARFSVTVRMDPQVRATITAIPEEAWTPIRHPRHLG